MVCVCVRLACRQLLLLHAYVTSTLLQQDSFDHDGDGVRLCQYSSRQLHETMASEHFRLLAGSFLVCALRGISVLEWSRGHVCHRR